MLMVANAEHIAEEGIRQVQPEIRDRLNQLNQLRPKGRVR